jgi:hypothetical protein
VNSDFRYTPKRENRTMQTGVPGSVKSDEGMVEQPLEPLSYLPVIRIHKANIRRWRAGVALIVVAEFAASLIDTGVRRSGSGGAHPAGITGIIVGVVIAAVASLLKWGLNRRDGSRLYFFGRATARSLARQGEGRPQGDLWLDNTGMTFQPDRSELFSTIRLRWADLEEIDLWSRFDRARLRLTPVGQRSQEFSVRNYDGLVDAFQRLQWSAADDPRREV